MTNLVDMRLQRNYIEGLIPAGITSLSKLSLLDLSFNKFSGLIPKGIEKLSRLVDIRLCCNDFTGVVGTAEWDLPNLYNLDISFNRHLRIQDGLWNSVNLKQLGIERINMSCSSLVNIGRISGSLSSLKLNHNHQLTSCPFPAEILELTNLKRLAIAESWKGPIPAGISRLSKLEYLDISYAGYNGTVPKAIENLTELNFLMINGEQIRGN